MKRATAMILALLVLLPPATALGQASLPEYKACGEGTTAADTRIFACSRVIGDTTQPDDIRLDAMQSRAVAYVAKGDRTRAVADLDEAIRQSSEPPSEALLLRALFRIFENDHDRATEDLAKVLAAADRRPNASLFRGLMEMATTNDPAQAAAPHGRALLLRNGAYLTPVGQALHEMRFSLSLRAVAYVVRSALHARNGDRSRASADLRAGLLQEQSQEAKKAIRDFTRQIAAAR
jgi:hypothetical protein